MPRLTETTWMLFIAAILALLMSVNIFIDHNLAEVNRLWIGKHLWLLNLLLPLGILCAPRTRTRTAWVTFGVIQLLAQLSILALYEFNGSAADFLKLGESIALLDVASGIVLVVMLIRANSRAV